MTLGVPDYITLFQCTQATVMEQHLGESLSPARGRLCG